MNERRRPFRRGRGQRPSGPRTNEPYGDADPYRDAVEPAPQESESFDAPRPNSDMNGSGNGDETFASPVDAPPPPPAQSESSDSAPPQQQYFLMIRRPPRNQFGGQQGGTRQQHDRDNNRRD